MELEDGPTGPAKVRRLGPQLLELTIAEGRNRQVRRMCEAVGHPVLELTRDRVRAAAPRPAGAGRPPPPERARRSPGWAPGSDRIARMGLFALRGATTRRAQRRRGDPRRDDGADARRSWSATTLRPEQVISCVFTATHDLDAEFPAVAARAVGFESVPLLCAQEIPVPGSLPRVIRVLIHYHADDGHIPEHVYLGEARALRADLHAAQ